MKIRKGVAYHCKSKEAMSVFLEIAEKQGLQWEREKNPTEFNPYVKDISDCISFDCLGDGYLGYCDVNYYKRKGLLIVNFWGKDKFY